jgi:hypothetical protein
VVVGALALDRRDLGMLACGAGACVIATDALKARLLSACHAFHIAGGLLMLALFHSAEAAGALALPVGLFLTAGLGARAAARYVSPSVAPLAGRLPWRFEDAYRRQALQFGAVGLIAAVAAMALGPNLVVRVLGVGLLPLTLRVYMGQLLSPSARTEMWSIAAAANGLILLLFVPFFGAVAAAAALVLGETVLFVGSAMVIADRTGVAPCPRPRIAVAAGAVLLLGPLAIPAGGIWLLVILLGLGAIAGIWHVAREGQGEG